MSSVNDPEGSARFDDLFLLAPQPHRTGPRSAIGESVALPMAFGNPRTHREEVTSAVPERADLQW